MKKKIIAILLALTLAASTAALAAGEGLPEGATPSLPPLPEPGTVFASYAGTISDVSPYYTNEIIEEGKCFVLIETEEGPIRFFVNEESNNITGQLPQVGDTFIGYYDMALPVIMIYPPQYGAVAFAVNLDKVEYIVNGKKIEAPTPFINDFNVLVPVRAISEALGYKAEWNKDDNAAEIGDDIRFNLDKDGYTIGKDVIELGIAPVVVNDRAFVPLSFFRQVIKMNNAYYFEGQVVINNDEKME